MSALPRPFVRVVIVVLVLILLVAALSALGIGLADPANGEPSSSGPPTAWSLSSLNAALDRELDGRWYRWAAAVASSAVEVPRPMSHPDPVLEPEPSAVDGERVNSTAYCLSGTMADGAPVRRGAVAANAWPIGTRLRVSPSPVGEIVTVEDRIGSGSQLDFALPGDCGAARAWGRRTVTVEVLGDG